MNFKLNLIKSSNFPRSVMKNLCVTILSSCRVMTHRWYATASIKLYIQAVADNFCVFFCLTYRETQVVQHWWPKWTPYQSFGPNLLFSHLLIAHFFSKPIPVYGMWNIYIASMIILYAPSHKRWPSDNDQTQENIMGEEIEFSNLPSDSNPSEISSLTQFARKTALD